MSHVKSDELGGFEISKTVQDQIKENIREELRDIVFKIVSQ